MKKSKALAIALCATVMTGLYAMDVQAVTIEELEARVAKLENPTEVHHKFGDKEEYAEWRGKSRYIESYVELEDFYSMVHVGSNFYKEAYVDIKARYDDPVSKAITFSEINMDDKKMVIEHGCSDPSTDSRIELLGDELTLIHYSDHLGTGLSLLPTDVKIDMYNFNEDTSPRRTISLVGLDTRVGNLEDVVKAGGVGGAAPDLSVITDRLTSLETNDTKQDGRLNKLEAGGTGGGTGSGTGGTVDLSGIEKRLKDLEDKPDVDLSGVEGRLTDLEGKPDVDLSGINAKNDAQDARLNALENGAGGLGGDVSDIKGKDKEQDTALKAETDRATEAETTLGTRVDNEITRATEAETALGGRIDDEITRATEAEAALGGRIDDEITRATAAETALGGRIDGEITRATMAEGLLNGRVDAEVDRAKAAEKALTDDLAAEVKRSTAEDIRLDGALTAEVDRAKAAEEALTDGLAAEVKRSTDEDIRLDGALKAEIKRSTDEDIRLDKALTTETNERIAADVALNNRVTRLDGKVDKVGAGAAALAGLHPMEYDPEDKLTFAAGIGNYGSETAAALGMFYRPNEKVMFSASSTMGNNENMVNMGLSFALDRTDNTYHTSKKAMAEEIMELRAALAEEQAQNAAQNEQNAEMRAQIQALMQMVRELQQK